MGLVMKAHNPVECSRKKDNRVWSLYNDSLVKRMEELLDLNSLKHAMKDLREQNRGKNGRPFTVPDGVIEIFARIRAVFNASFRMLESLLRIIGDILGIPGISYTSIFRRIRKISVPEILNPSVSIAVDSTGFKTTIRGDWLLDKWGKKRRGWIKLHASLSTESVAAQKIITTK